MGRFRWFGVAMGLVLAGCGNGAADQPTTTTATQPTTIATAPTTTEAGSTPKTTATAPQADHPNRIGSASEAFELVMAWLGGQRPTSDEYAAQFGPSFIDQVAHDDFLAVLDQLEAGGPWTVVENQIATETELAAVIDSPSEQAESLNVQLAIEDGRFVSLLFTPARPFDEPGSLDETVLRLEAIGDLRYGIFEVSDGACEALGGPRAEEPMPLGSIFKLYVLAAVQTSVDNGELSWSDPVTIRDELDSYPSGTTQDLEPGTTLTVQELAELMISISDNTATDHLIDLVGRSAVEQAVALSGHAVPQLLEPFLTTRELFVLKTEFSQGERDEYVAADVDRQRQILETTVADATLGPLSELAWPAPIDVETLEWFASPVDLCEVLVALVGNAEVREILSINPGIPDSTRRWDFIGFKGGSEPGVLAMAWYVENDSGAAFVVAGSVADSNAPLDELEAVNLFGAMRDTAAEG